MSLPPLSKFQRARCLEVINGIERFGISKVFSKPVDPKTDNCPDYLEIIKKPMDLGTVRKNLNNDKYTSVREWRRDMDLIWENARIFNGDTSIINKCAEQLKQVYKSLSESITENQVDDWMKELEYINKKIHKIKKRICKEVEEGNLQYVKEEEIQPQTYEKPSRKLEVQQQPAEEVILPKPARKPVEDEIPPPPKIMQKKEEPAYKPPTPRENNTYEEVPPQKPIRKPPKQEEPPAPPTPPRAKKLSIEVCNRIYDEFINANEDDRDSVTDIITKYEGIDPTEQPELDISKLKLETQQRLAEFFKIPYE